MVESSSGVEALVGDVTVLGGWWCRVLLERFCFVIFSIFFFSLFLSYFFFLRLFFSKKKCNKRAMFDNKKAAYLRQ